MALHFSSSVIIVTNIEISKTFYTELLQQHIEHDFGKNIIFQSGFAIWELRDTHIIAKKISKEKRQRGNRFELYFETENLDTIFTSLKDASITFLHEIHTEPWTQRTIRFFDPDHHLIEIGETLECFVQRSFKQLKDVEKVAETTYTSIELVQSIIHKPNRDC